MPLLDRVIQVKLKFPNTGEEQAFDRMLDQSLRITVKSSKNILIIQNTCEIEVYGLNDLQRAQLMSNFTAWNYRKNPSRQYVGVEVFAAYDNTDSPGRVFVGDVVKCGPIGENPNHGVQITAYTRQIDRTNLITASLPTNPTFKQAVDAVAAAAGLTSDCKTRIDNKVIPNFGSFQVNPLQAPQHYTIQAAIGMLWRVDPDGVGVWVDDDVLYARDIGAVIDPNNIIKLDSFVGTPPTWNEWGIVGTVLYTPGLTVAAGIDVVSKMNPGVNGQYVVTSLDCNLASRDTPFYMTFKASPPQGVS